MPAIAFSGPLDDAIDAGLASSGNDAVYFEAAAPNPKFDPEDYIEVRGKKKFWGKPTINIAYLTIELKGDAYSVGKAWTHESYRRQGIIRRLYDMAWDYARSKGKGFQAGWVQSPLMAKYWESLVDQGKAEAYTDEWTQYNTTGKGWRRIRASSGKHKLPKLPYAYDALEPHISEETLRFHHDKHHKAYVDGLNDAEKAIAAARKAGDFEAIPALNAAQAFNAGGHFLHTLYWESLTPERKDPSESLVAAIVRDFGSWDAFRSQMKESTVKVRGSGWGVLVYTPAGMRISTVMNHENGVLWDGGTLLPIDAWEHAYYLDYQNDRAAHFDAVFDNLVDWEKVEGRLKAAEANLPSKTAAQRRRRNGDCYAAAGRYIMDNPDSHLQLVHGEVSGQGALEGTTFGHAWVLDGDQVIDQSNGRNLRLPKVVYYALGGIDRIDNLHVYSREQALDRMLKHKHFGPWDLKTRSGL
jgi:superoxide dismutase/GNAT superfamily N-acetyltransferase